MWDSHSSVQGQITEGFARTLRKLGFLPDREKGFGQFRFAS